MCMTKAENISMDPVRGLFDRCWSPRMGPNPGGSPVVTEGAVVTQAVNYLETLSLQSNRIL